MTFDFDYSAGERVLQRTAEDPHGMQDSLLKELLARNANTEVGRRFGFSELRSLSEFQRRLPFSTYEELRPSIERMMRGERDILFAGDPAYVAQTSGTSGDPKYCPYPKELEFPKGKVRVGAWFGSIERRHPGCLQQMLHFSAKYNEGTTASGVTIGQGAGYFRWLYDGHPMFRILPKEVFEEIDFEARYYLVLRLGIPQPVRLLMAFNPSTLLVLSSIGAKFADELIADLKEGGLQHGPTSAVEFAKSLDPSYLKRDEEAASRVAGTIQRTGRFSLTDVWPELKVFCTWKAAMTVHYLRELRSMYPEVAQIPMMNGSTEATFSIPVEDDWAGGVPALFETLLEFFPEEEAPDCSAPIDISDLRDGECYRVAVTNHRGLYRYLMEDIYVVDGKYREVPLITFSHRFGSTSSLTGEKLTEQQIIQAMEQTQSVSEIHFVDFQYAPVWGSPPGYVLLAEFDRPYEEGALREFLHCFESALVDVNLEYSSKRSSGRLAQPKIVCLQQGEFVRQRKAKTAGRGRTDATVKIARLEKEIVDLEELNVASMVSW